VTVDAIVSLRVRGTVVESYSGILIAALALLVISLLAWWKRKIARETANRAIAADAVQSAAYAYLAAITLVSLAATAYFGVHWADPAAALVAVPIIAIQARCSIQGQPCGCKVS
jgi:divalent metal cation (Fe/Co/Zn/Cd) transporter